MAQTRYVRELLLWLTVTVCVADIQCPVNTEYCPAVLTPNGAAWDSYQRLLGHTMTASCLLGWESVGGSSLTCQDNGPAGGSWSGTVNDCTRIPNYCTLLYAPENGGLVNCPLLVRFAAVVYA